MNYVTQSAVSQAIAKLERQLGVSLVHHNRQKLVVTQEGKLLYQNAKNIFKSVQNTYDIIHDSQETLAGTLNFVTTKSLGMTFLAPMYRYFSKTFPLVDLKFKMGGLNLIRTRLRKEEAEFAIVFYDHHFSEFESIPLAKGKFHLYQLKGSPNNLIDQGVFVNDWEGPYVKELQHHFDHVEGKPIEVKSKTSGWELTAQFTHMGIGVGFFPDYLVKNQRYPHLEIYPVPLPDFEYQISAIHSKSSPLSRSARAFIEKFTLDT